MGLHGNSAKSQHFSVGMKPQVHMFDNPDGKAYAFGRGIPEMLAVQGIVNLFTIRRLGLSLQNVNFFWQNFK